MPFVTNDGVRIYYESEGDGPAVVFHTGSGGDLRIWRDAGYVAGLPGFRKILVDQRGRGRSDRPNTIEEHRIDRYVSDLACIFEDAGVASAAFWGYSRGVLAGIAFGARHPERLWALVGTGSLPHCNLVDLSAPGDPESTIQADVAAGGVRAELEGCMAEEHDRFPPRIEENVLEGDLRMHALDRVAWREWRGPLDLYPELRVPVLMLTGAGEDPDRETERSIGRLQDGRVVRFPGLGHLGSFYRSDVALPVAIPFLRRAANRAGGAAPPATEQP